MRLRRADVLAALVEALEEQCAVARAQAAIAHDEATSDETRQEGKYDTRAIEASYLAQAQAQRLQDVERSLGHLRVMPSGPPRTLVDGPCLVCLERDEGSAWYLLAPAAPGLRVSVSGTKVRVLSPASPLGRELLGAEVGDETSTGAELVWID